MKKRGLLINLKPYYLMSLMGKKIKMRIKVVLLSIDFIKWDVFVNMHIREMKRVVGKKKFNLLDLGCGDGKLVKEALKQGITAIGIDEKQGQMIEDYDPEGKKYEVISMYHVIEHLDKPVEVLKKIKGWLKPGGMVVVELPLAGNLSEKWLGKDYLIYWDKTHVNFWTKKEFLEVIEKAGYRVVGKGLVWHQVFFHVITAKFKSGIGQSLVGMILWLPFKLLSIIGFNDEMMRVYLKRV